MSSDVDNLFNGGPYYPDEDEHLYCPEEEESQNRITDETLAKNFKGPLGIVESEQITNGTTVIDKGKTKILVASFDSAMRGVCMAEILRDVAELEDVVPQTKMCYTANGEFAYDVNGDKTLLYYLDKCIKWTNLKNSNKVARLIFMSGALKALDDTDWKQFRIDDQQSLSFLKPSVCSLVSVAFRVEQIVIKADKLD